MRSKCLIGRGTMIILASALSACIGQGRQQASQPETLVARAGAAVQEEQTDHPVLKRRNPRYQLSCGDVLEISLPLTPEFNQTATIQPDGYLTLLAVGDLHVEGQTVPEATQSIRAAYVKKLHDPIITIQLKDFQKPFFIVGGQVGHPGKYELRGGTTVTQAVAIAGSFTEAAKHSQVWLFRRVSNDWVEVQKLNLKKMLNSGNLREDPLLRPGDMVYVPKNVLMKISRFIPSASMGTYISPPL